MRKIMLSISALMFLCAPLAAQTDTAAVRVLVADQTEAGVPNAEVALTNTSTNVVQHRITGADGYAVFTAVQRGTYDIQVTMAGFRGYRLSGVTVNVDERKLVRVPLEVATVTETIEVVADVAAVQTEQGSLGQVISGTVAAELPLAGRRYSELALLVPGVTASTLNTVTRGPGWFVANGNFHTQNNFLLDGIDNNQASTNAQALSAQVVQPSPDAISEFKVQTNSFSAEFGRSAGAVVNVSLKSGTNETHGSAWYYNRDSALAANSWRANLVGADKENLKWHQYGGTVGGRIIREKLFYFTDYEGFRRSFDEFFVTSVPTAPQRNGVFNFNVLDPDTRQPLPNRTIPSDRFDALGKKLVDLYPAGNLEGRAVAGGRVVDNYGVGRPGTEDTHKFNIRSDYYASQQDQFVFRYSFLEQDISRQAIFPGVGDGVGNQGKQFNRNQSVMGTWTRVISPNMINVARFGYNRTFAEFAHATQDGQTGTDFGFVGIPEPLTRTGGLPLIDLANYNDLGTRNFRPQYQTPMLWHYMNHLSVVRGTHSMRMGVEFRDKNNEFIDVTRATPAYRFRGRFTGNDVGDLLVGYPDRLTVNTLPIVEQLQKAWSGFFQDDWKVTPRFTLNLGMRYEYTTPFYGAEPNVNINFDPATGNLLTANDDDKYLVTADRNNWSPRLGAAYQLVPSKVVLRGGYGVFYSLEDIYGSEANLPLNPPQLIQVNLEQVGSGPPPLKLSEAIPGNALSSYDSRLTALRTREREQQAAIIHQWNITTEFLLPMDSTFELAYVGNRGSNLFALWQRNQTDFGVDGSVAANRPFPEWQGIQTGATRAKSSYNALQAKYEKRFSKGWNTLVSYTWASALDEAGAWSEGNSPVYFDDFRGERGPHTQTARHRVTIAGVWQLPFGRGHAIGQDWHPAVNAILGGWQVSGIVTGRTGLPVNVTLAASGVNPATGQLYNFKSRNGGGLRPNHIGPANTGVDPKEDRFNFLNVQGFAVQPVDTRGSAGRNVALGPNLVNFDTSFVKRFAIGEQMSADLRWEFFNLFNQTNFAQPNGGFGGSSFGIINDAMAPRIIQVAVRFQF
jgi:hypothetical protein